MQVVASPSGRPVTREDGTGLGLADGPGFMASFADAFTKVAPSLAAIYTTNTQMKIAATNARMQQQYGGGPTQYYPPAAAPMSNLMMPLVLGGAALLAVVMLRK